MQAFAPASVTTVFTPTDDGQGSRGVSIALSAGVTATVTRAPDGEGTLTYGGDPVDIPPVAGVLDRLGVDADVALESEVPIGSGFGVSGAATLSTAIAADATFDLCHDRAAVLDAAYRAEVAAGTGLGDVFVQDMGGVAYDFGDGRHSVPSDAALGWVSYGGISTADLLGDPAAVDRVRDHGSAALADLAAAGTVTPVPDLGAIADVGWEFAQATGLATDRVVAAVEDVRAAGGSATMAMVGETVVVPDPDEAVEARLDATTGVANEGARLL